MEIALILLILLCILSLAWAIVASVIAWRSLVSFFAAEAQKEEYQRYMAEALDEIKEKSEIFRTEMAKRMGMDIPEVKYLNGLLHDLEVKMNSFKEVLNAFLREEGY